MGRFYSKSAHTKSPWIQARYTCSIKAVAKEDGCIELWNRKKTFDVTVNKNVLQLCVIQNNKMYRWQQYVSMTAKCIDDNKMYRWQNVSMKRHVQEKYNKPGRIPQERSNLYSKKRRCIHIEKQTKKDSNRFVISDILRGPSQLFQTLKLVDDQETEYSLFCMSSYLLNSMSFRRELLIPTSPTGPRPLAVKYWSRKKL